MLFRSSIAERRGRNVQWAEDAVRKSVSVTAREALKLGVIDLVSRNLEGLLDKIDGMKVKTPAGEKVLHTGGASVVRKEMGLRLKILALIAIQILPIY